ncbi:MAG: hypothetical protein IT365_04095 [Candidatus Hydrogenedentes bacterium]|nr:hypothetical protein [Candidatus Hydrogenedentota bacterium]
MEAMIDMPGGVEWLIIVFVGLLTWVIPITFAIWLIITLNAIRQDLAAIRKRLEAPRE